MSHGDFVPTLLSCPTNSLVYATAAITPSIHPQKSAAMQTPSHRNPGIHRQQSHERDIEQQWVVTAQLAEKHCLVLLEEPFRRQGAWREDRHDAGSG